MKRIFWALILICSSFAHAAPKETAPELSRFVSEEIREISHALEMSESEVVSLGDSFVFSRFMLRVQAKFAFKLASFAKLELVPEIEMVWDRRKASARSL